MISNEEILKVVLPNNHEQEVEELNSDPLPSITHSEAIEHYDKEGSVKTTFYFCETNES
ncbi:hypothetical protein RhiirB3_426095 [Rhizophagus irregularis]|uniref:Uncharacterized protein n=1 Tax=Rhizophagus irregularis (strain DAOM 181602 / DAOM 197198 / MUCL 43194) TaxID=747089 RepID=U9SZ78_RHIID|nr:hypothetical protein RhiirB3_426095 [Rhizophagus irregularis]